MPKIEESTFIAKYQDNLEEHAYAFYFLEHNVEHLTEKMLFVANKDLAGHISLADDNQYISLIDVFWKSRNQHAISGGIII